MARARHRRYHAWVGADKRKGKRIQERDKEVAYYVLRSEVCAILPRLKTKSIACNAGKLDSESYSSTRRRRKEEKKKEKERDLGEEKER